MTVREILNSFSTFPIPVASLDAIGKEVGIDLDDNVDSADETSLNWAKARVCFYLASVPNVSEGGVSISFSAAERANFLAMARRYAKLAGKEDLVPGLVKYGYKGENL